MGRLAHIIRFVALLSLLVVVSHGRVPTTEAIKGFRAVVFSGALLHEPVRIGDFDTATALYLRVMRGTAVSGDSLAALEGRRCVIISAFLANDRNMNTPLETLPEGQGDFNYRLYVFSQGVRPVMAAGQHRWRLTQEVTQDLAALGVPIADTNGATAGCQ
ncbi:MAG TPA: hypothetical protein VFD64_14960 [Gemmatimonadaceae bacterium]|nr:hypothetical protein [Gemmatimonadaceae bacterium]